VKRKVLLSTLVLISSCAILAAQSVSLGGSAVGKDKNEAQGKNLTGQVLGQGDAPLPDAIVYLKNTKTLAVKSFIAEKDGGYRFHGLSPNVDYEIYAEYQGQKSSLKTLSSFDNRANVTLNLHINPK
jgi:Carboxypeptidase regulatory-like domain